MHFQLEAYEGPLELLLRLIEKNEIDIYNIPMAQLTDQYLEAIRHIPPDMENMSEFLLMAATLLEIKSNMLIPRNKIEEEDEEDPQEAFVKKIIAYKHCQELASILKDIPNAGTRLFKGPEYPLMSKAVIHSPEDWLHNIVPDNLWEVFVDVMKRQVRKVDTIRQNFGTIPKARYTVTEKIEWIEKLLQKLKTIHLSELFAKCNTKEECLVTFLAMLELVRRRKAAANQKDMFGEIRIKFIKEGVYAQPDT